MPDPVLIVPGTQATALQDQNGTIVYNPVRVGISPRKESLGGRPREEWVALLGMSHVAGQLEPERTSLEDGTTLTPAFVVQTPYALFPKFYEEWPYDWRADLRWNADRLLDELRARRSRGDARATLIGHSQGGILIVLAAKRAAPGEFARLVCRVVLVGAPLAGTLVAAEALVDGSEGLGDENRHLALALARMWPALYQMLPAWGCVCADDGEPFPDAEQLVQREGWPPGLDDGIDADLLLRVREVQAALVDPLGGFGPGVAVRAVMSTNQTTPARLARGAAGFGTLSREPAAGDNLVHFRRTLEWGGKPFGFTCVAYGKGTRPHAELCTDHRIAGDIVRFVAEPPPPEPV